MILNTVSSGILSEMDRFGSKRVSKKFHKKLAIPSGILSELDRFGSKRVSKKFHKKLAVPSGILSELDRFGSKGSGWVVIFPYPLTITRTSKKLVLPVDSILF